VLTIVVAVVVFAMMILEASLASRNEQLQRTRGGIEPPGDVYDLMRIAYPAAFLAMIVEGWLRGGPTVIVVAIGAMLFLDAKTLKWWAIRSLGQAWTFRVIVVPGAPLVDSGPYKLMRHPNYVAVIGELISVMLMTGAWTTGPLMTVLFGTLILKRMKVEERALEGR
jgi:methyltransferase